MLARLAPGSTTEVMQELHAFLSHLNISGLGLVAATERSPLVSLLVSARPRNPEGPSVWLGGAFTVSPGIQQVPSCVRGRFKGRACD